MNATQTTRIMAGAGALLALATAAWATNLDGVRQVALVAAALIALIPIGYKAWQAVKFRVFAIELLVTIAVIGALIIGEFVEAAVVSFLFLFGAYLEARSLTRTRAYLQDLTNLAPDTATVLTPDGQRVQVPAHELAEGDMLAVVSGTRIAADAIITSGKAEFDEAPITGESLPVTKTVGDTIYAGTTLTAGYVQARANQVGANTTFSHIVTLVEEASETRTKTMRFLERFAQIYTPTVIGLALLVGVITQDAELGLTFLVIACPGALVISVPVAIVAGVGNLARQGVLVTSGEGIENLARATTMMVDKTGTLTQGRPHLAHATSDHALALAAAVENYSEHHLARAIVEGATERGLALGQVQDVVSTPGQGISATVDGATVNVGKLTDLTAPPHLRTQVQDWENAGMTAVYVTRGQEVIGALAISDQPRPEASQALEALHGQGVNRIAMLTGDNHAAATHVAHILGITEVHSRCLPADKSDLVRQAQAEGERVIMVGDGVNDAPALALADVGVAMGGAGTDVSQGSADVILMTDELDKLATAKAVASRTFAVMRQNTAIAVGTVALLLAGVLTRHVGLASGMLVHEISVIAVVLNALRIAGFTRPRSGSTQQSERELVGTVG